MVETIGSRVWESCHETQRAVKEHAIQNGAPISESECGSQRSCPKPPNEDVTPISNIQVLYMMIDDTYMEYSISYNLGIYANIGLNL